MLRSLCEKLVFFITINWRHAFDCVPKKVTLHLQSAAVHPFDLLWLTAVATMAMTPHVGSPYAEQCSSRTSYPKWDGKPRVVKCPCQSSLHGYCQSISSLVFSWGGDHGYNHAEAHIGIAACACGSHDQYVNLRVRKTWTMSFSVFNSFSTSTFRLWSLLVIPQIFLSTDVLKTRNFLFSVRNLDTKRRTEDSSVPLLVSKFLSYTILLQFDTVVLSSICWCHSPSIFRVDSVLYLLLDQFF